MSRLSWDRGRPAEFRTTDDESKLLSLGFERLDAPPPAGAPTLLGSWEQPLNEFRIPGSNEARAVNATPMIARVEVYDGTIFIGNLPGFSTGGDWIGGTYTVDTSRKPPGIDIVLFNSLQDGVRKLYGSYEATPNGLKLALGLTGKRAARPMDFATTKNAEPPERMYFELRRAVLRWGENRAPAPPPRAK